MRLFAILVVLGVSGVSAAAPRTLRTLQGAVWTVRQTGDPGPAATSRCRLPRLFFDVVERGKPSRTIKLGVECTLQKGDDLGSYSFWIFHERVDVGGHSFVVLGKDNACCDHRSVDYYLFDLACGKAHQLGVVGSHGGFEFDAQSLKETFAPSVVAKGDASAPWQRLEVNGAPRRWSAATCAWEPDDPPE